ncbi:hypothetical protein ASF52_11720 [Methylobacterium sp. Leaf112]|nr:hypothetical protein ASF52_11720 [Methylobacterium sp. Leaf112]
MGDIMISRHLDETRVTAEAPFENAEWSVSPEGLEHRPSGYFIARDLLGMRRGDLWEWPLHLSEKSWCRALPFREAFLAALSAFEIPRDAGLIASFATGFGLKAGQSPAKTADDFVALGDVLRPKGRKQVDTRNKQADARKRSVSPEIRGGHRRNGTPVPYRAVEASPQRAAY